MDRISPRVPRVFTGEELAAGREVTLAAAQGHYLTGVMRLKPGDPVRLFNGRDGEWLCCLVRVSRKSVAARPERRSGEVVLPPDIDFMFAPLKHARLDDMVEKAVELGARRLCPVITAHTVAARVNLDRMRAIAIEAAEQCNLTVVPEVLAPVPLERLLADWQPDRALVFCDETAATADPLAALRHLRLPAALLTGPEGGFSAAERAALLRLPAVTAISLGPRILRAGTAALAALSLLQASLGDWRAA